MAGVVEGPQAAMKSLKVVSMTQFHSQPVVRLEAFARRQVAAHLINLRFTFMHRRTIKESSNFRTIFPNGRGSLQIGDLFEKDALRQPDLRGQRGRMPARLQLREVPTNPRRSL